jgi:CDGSH-type Zn-finger protein/uncharacterized Fe-S cluster protein YjdI
VRPDKNGPDRDRSQLMPGPVGIDSVEALRTHLQTALEIEHATLPPYLCALYSIVEGTNQGAVEVLQSVVMEEMLHLTLAANILNAVGGRPAIDSPALLPGRPAFLPHSDRSVELSLRPFTRTAVEGFMAIERPGDRDSPAQDDSFATIGQFYRAIGDALVRLNSELGADTLFCGNPDRQVTAAAYYGGAGRILAVTDLASARLALAEIVEQGEGIDHQSIYDGDRDMFHPEREEIAHYFRFRELILGRRYTTGDTPASGPSGAGVAVDWSAVHPMRVNPTMSDHPEGSVAHRAMAAFNSSYCAVLGLLDHTFNGVPTLLAEATGAMYGIKHQMIELIRLDSADGISTVGPSFEWVAPESRHFPDTHILVVPHGPYLVRGDVDIHDTAGDLVLHDGVCVLCRCGGSRTKPFCDGTHSRIAFDGTESADHRLIAERRDSYPTPDGATIYDDRTRCAHFGQCTDKLPSVFGVSEDAFVDPLAAPTSAIARVVGGCPSGALAFAATAGEPPVEVHDNASIRPIVDGPYRVRGGVEVVGADNASYEVRERQTLCRCGQSRNKPFCDGSHWYAGFRDPLPPELADAAVFRWTDPGAAERGRERYAREHESTAVHAVEVPAPGPSAG